MQFTGDKGVAHASSVHDSHWPAKDAFRRVHHGWASSGEQRFPAKVWFAFHEPASPSAISFRSRQTSLGGAQLQMPRRFQFIGSNDAECKQDSVWVILCEGSNMEPQSSLDERRGCRVKRNLLGLSYRCLGLNILEVAPNYPVTSLNDIQIIGS